MATKQFKVPRQDKPALDFELVFDRMIDGEWVEQTEKFKARSSIPGNLLLAMTAAINASEGIQAQQTINLLHRSITKDDEERFFKVLDDPDTAVPLETLVEIMVWLAGEYSERPTQSASSS
jgi:hypothetical protein